MNPSPLPASIKPGDRVGDYEILQILGQGGMGAVYKVRNVISERIEAMKVLLPNLEGDPGLADRFLREIKVQAALDHPNIAKLNTAMQVGQQIVMILEFVDGTSIEQLLQQGSIPPSSAVSYTMQVLNALAYAHQHGVVHRDIKPANIMVTGNGTVKLMDFGIARIKADQRLTSAGGTVGSLLYMSPEQIKGVEPDGRADIYSLGITLYEMVTGRRPFAADSDFQLMSAHLMQPPVAPMEVIPGVPQDLNDIILMAMAKEPENRFQSAAAFRGALGSVAGEIPTPAGTAHALGTVTRTIERPAMTPPPTLSPTLSPMLPPTLPQTPAYVPPLMAASAMPPPVLQQQPSSRRGLYMALGSLATLAVLVFAVIEGPKLMHGGNSGAAAPLASTTGTTTPAPVAAEPTQTPIQPPIQIQPPSEPANVPTNIASTTPASATPAPVSEPKELPSRPRQNLTPTNIVAPSMAQSIQRAQNQAVPEPGFSNQGSSQNPPPRPAVNPELNEARERYNQLAIKASALKDGVNVMQQNLARQGLGLRAEVLQSRTGLDYQMQEAMQSLRNGDVEAAKQSLTYAEGNAAKLARFLGQ